MPIYKPSELRQFLSDLGIHPKKVLSQNFLIDGNIIRKIVDAAHVEPSDVVLEIGPGPGSLSEVLLERGANLIAVEKDTVLANALGRLKTESNQLEIFCQDVMEFDFKKELGKHLALNSKAKLIANLPYHLTTPILCAFVKERETFSSLVVMVQEEVGRRFTALPGGEDYSSFTVFLNFYCTPRYAFTVSKHCFYPEPKVQSAVVVLDLKEPPAVSDPEAFFLMTRTAFGQRRKMLRASLRPLYETTLITAALTSLGIDPQIRPEELSLQQFISLFELLNC